MGIQSSVNGLMQQIYNIGAISAGLRQQRKQTNEAQIQTDIASGNATMKDGKVDPEWLQKRREEFYKNYKPTKEIYKKSFYSNGNLTNAYGKVNALNLQEKVKRGIELDSDEKEFYNDSRVQDYLKSINDEEAIADSAIEAQSANSELKNEVAGKLARASVKSRTASINQTKSNFDEHVASLIRYYGKGSGNP